MTTGRVEYYRWRKGRIPPGLIARIQIPTNSPQFDGFPMFSPCGRYLVFASNRNGKNRGDTNLFVCEWVE